MIRHSIDNDKSETWTQRIAWTAIIGVIAGGIGWASWISIELNKKIAYEDLIAKSPYSHDKAWVHDSIANHQKNIDELSHKVEGKFADTIQANTEAIIQLKEQMKYNNKVLEQIINTLNKKNIQLE